MSNWEVDLWNIARGQQNGENLPETWCVELLHGLVELVPHLGWGGEEMGLALETGA